MIYVLGMVGKGDDVYVQMCDVLVMFGKVFVDSGFVLLDVVQSWLVVVDFDYWEDVVCVYGEIYGEIWLVFLLVYVLLFVDFEICVEVEVIVVWIVV